MKRSGFPRRTSELRRSGRIKPKKRSAEARARIYGEGDRAAWMKQQPCLICGRTPSDSAHLTNGGTGRKDDSARTVPLCADVVAAGYSGHHSEYDGGKRSFRAKYATVDLEAAATEIEAEWQGRVA